MTTVYPEDVVTSLGARPLEREAVLTRHYGLKASCRAYTTRCRMSNYDCLICINTTEDTHPRFFCNVLKFGYNGLIEEAVYKRRVDIRVRL